MRYHPWRELRRLPHVIITWADPGPGLLATYEWATGLLRMRPGMPQVQRRSVLAHELAHIERGDHHGCDARAEAREEAACDEVAARRLITDEALLQGLLWARDEHELADELWVDVDTARVRLACLSAAERAALAGRLWAAEARLP